MNTANRGDIAWVLRQRAANFPTLVEYAAFCRTIANRVAAYFPEFDPEEFMHACIDGLGDAPATTPAKGPTP